MRKNSELGIYKVKSELAPILKEIQDNGHADITHMPSKVRTRLGQLCKHTCSLQYEKRTIIKADKPLKVIAQNPDYTKIQIKQNE